MVAAFAFLFLTYLQAAVPWGLVLSTLYGADDDIRAAGSGNIGATNVARVYGWKLAAPVLLLDMGKGLVPVVFAPLVWPAGGVAWLGTVAITAFLGHCYPVFLAFRGGKGVATGAGAMLGLAPVPTLSAAATWALVLALFGRSSAASLAATGVLVLVSWLVAPHVLVVTAVLAGLVVHSHMPNIRRLIAGDEKAILRPVRWGSAADRQELDAAEVLARGPGGTAVAPPLWREASPDADPGEPTDSGVEEEFLP